MNSKTGVHRPHIPLATKLAAALSMLLPQEERDRARADKVSAKAILKLFQFDHGVLYSFGGSDEWWNLTPMQVKLHREKSRADTSIVAKVDRIIARQQQHRSAMRQMKLSKWPKRKLRSRPLHSR